jgi:hypothetical protein
MSEFPDFASPALYKDIDLRVKHENSDRLEKRVLRQQLLLRTLAEYDNSLLESGLAHDSAGHSF